MIIVQKIRLDLFLQSRSTVTVAKQGDIDSRFLEATICANGKPVVVPANSAASLNMTRSDGMTNSTICTCNDDGTVTIPLIQWALALPGDIYCSLSINTESEKLTTLSFRVKVERSEYNENQIVVYSVYETSLDPRTYHIRIAGNSYQFTTSYTVPAGGVIRFNTILTKAYTYSTESLESEIEADINLVEGTGGTELVTSGEATIINELANEIANRVPITRTVNSKSLETNIILNASDIPNDSSVSGVNVDDALDTLDNNKVPITRTINSKSLETNIVLNSTDIENNSSIFDGDNISEVFESIDGKIDEVVSDIDNKLDQKANVDGYYETLGAGTADQLISPDGVTDTPETDADYNPFVFRPTGGSTSVSSGNASIEKIRGSSIVWNQLASLDTSKWNKQRASMSVSDTEITMAVVGTSTSSKYVELKLITSHKFLVSFTRLSTSDVNGTIGIYGYGSGNEYSQRITLPDRSEGDYAFSSIFYTDSTHNAFRFYFATTSAADTTLIVKDLQIIDLTQMFGSTTADYLYNLEQTTEGVGIAWFRNLFPKNYYEYDPGTIKNVVANALRTIEFNAWDEEWESGNFSSSTGNKSVDASRIRSKNYIPVIPGETYYLKVPQSANIFKYDADKNYLGYNSATNITRTLGNNVYYVRFATGGSSNPVTTYNNDICLNLSHSGYRDGEYEPYKTHKLSLPISTYFPDGMNGVDTVYDEINFKTRKAIKRFGIVDLGTLTWNKLTTGNYVYYYASRAGTPGINYSAGKLGLVCSKYTAIANIVGIDYRNHDYDKTITVISDQGTSQGVAVQDSLYTTAADFKAAMNGVYLVYELATPVETDIPESVNNTYIESDFGTEEFVYSETDIPIKVPCEIKYIDNLREKIRNLNPMTTAELNEVLTILD